MLNSKLTLILLILFILRVWRCWRDLRLPDSMKESCSQMGSICFILSPRHEGASNGCFIILSLCSIKDSLPSFSFLDVLLLILKLVFYVLNWPPLFLNSETWPYCSWILSFFLRELRSVITIWGFSIEYCYFLRDNISEFTYELYFAWSFINIGSFSELG